MSYAPEPRRDVLSPDEVALSAAEMTTGFGEYLGADVASGFSTTVLGQATQNLPPLVGLQAAGKGSRIMTGNPADVIVEPTFKMSTSYRQGMPYEAGMTAARQAALAAERDAADYRDSLAARYQGGLVGHLAGFAATLLGGAASPESYIPFIGPEMRGAMMLRLGRVWGGAAAGAIEGLAGTAVTEPLVAQAQQQIGRDYGLPEIAADLLMGGAIGGGFGGLHGLLSRAPRVSPELTPESLAREMEGADLGTGGLQRQPRPAGDVLTPEVLARETDALNLATDAVARGEPVDVTGLVPPRAEPEPGSYIDAFHGTPHTFAPEEGAPAGRFRDTQIGTGEGAQAYGHGLYFAEQRSVAEEGYKNRLDPASREGSLGLAARVLEGSEGDRKAAIEELDRRLASMERRLVEDPASVAGDPQEFRDRIAEAKRIIESGGGQANLYSVRLHVRPEELLHWDKPLSEQSAHVRAALEPLRSMFPELFAADENGDELYQALAGSFRTEAYTLKADDAGQAMASQRLRELGIQGIRYLDAGSRGPTEAPTHNIVLFDPSRAEITHVNDRAVERPVPPPADLPEAARRVGKPEDTFAKDAGLEPSQATPVQTAEQKAVAAAKEAGAQPKPEPPGPLEADLQALRDAGRITPADEAALTEAHAEAEKIDGWADAYETLSTCVTRFGE